MYDPHLTHRRTRHPPAATPTDLPSTPLARSQPVAHKRGRSGHAHSPARVHIIEPGTVRGDRGQRWLPSSQNRTDTTVSYGNRGVHRASTSRPCLQISELARKVRLQPPQVGHKVTCERAQCAQRARTQYAQGISRSRARGGGGCEGMNGGVAGIIRA
jgi:hypothetical protein